MPFSWPLLLFLCGSGFGITSEDDRIDGGLRDAGEIAVEHLPGVLAIVLARNDLCGGGPFAASQDAMSLNDPAVAVFAPAPFAERAVRIEKPGADTLGAGVPADDLRPLQLDAVFAGDAIAAGQEILV